MANLKNFKTVIEEEISLNPNKFVEVLDKVLDTKTKETLIERILDMYANAIDNGQFEIEFVEDKPKPSVEFKWTRNNTLTDDDIKYCAHI